MKERIQQALLLLLCYWPSCTCGLQQIRPAQTSHAEQQVPVQARTQAELGCMHKAWPTS